MKKEVVIFYFSPNVNWELIEEVFGENYTDVETLTYAQCTQLNQFAFKEWGGEIEKHSLGTFMRAFNDEQISDLGYMRFFEVNAN